MLMVNPVYAPDLGGVVEHRTIGVVEKEVCAEKSRLPPKAIPCRPLTDEIAAWIEEASARVQPHIDRKTSLRRARRATKTKKGKRSGNTSRHGSIASHMTYSSDESLPLSQRSPDSNIDSDMEEDLRDAFAEELATKMMASFIEEGDVSTLEGVVQADRGRRERWGDVLQKLQTAREKRAREAVEELELKELRRSRDLQAALEGKRSVRIERIPTNAALHAVAPPPPPVQTAAPQTNLSAPNFFHHDEEEEEVTLDTSSEDSTEAANLASPRGSPARRSAINLKKSKKKKKKKKKVKKKKEDTESASESVSEVDSASNEDDVAPDDDELNEIEDDEDASDDSPNIEDNRFNSFGSSDHTLSSSSSSDSDSDDTHTPNPPRKGSGGHHLPIKKRLKQTQKIAFTKMAKSALSMLPPIKPKKTLSTLSAVSREGVSAKSHSMIRKLKWGAKRGSTQSNASRDTNFSHNSRVSVVTAASTTTMVLPAQKVMDSAAHRIAAAAKKPRKVVKKPPRRQLLSQSSDGNGSEEAAFALSCSGVSPSEEESVGAEAAAVVCLPPLPPAPRADSDLPDGLPLHLHNLEKALRTRRCRHLHGVLLFERNKKQRKIVP